jgi:hypothetical protein
MSKMPKSEVLVAVGLSRAWKLAEYQPSRHWPPVNNLITMDFVTTQK